MNLSVESQAVDGPEIEIDCPACGAQRTLATSQRVTEKLRLLHFIPLLTMRHNYVWCKACQKKLVSSLDVEELAHRSPTDISAHLSGDVSLVAKFMAIVGVVLFIVPIVGVLLALIAFLLSRNSPGWVRTTSIVGLVLGGLATALLTIPMFFME